MALFPRSHFIGLALVTLLVSGLSSLMSGFGSVVHAQEPDLSEIEKFRNTAPPSQAASWVQVGWSDDDITIFVDGNTIAQEVDPEIGDFVGFYSRLDIPLENVRVEFVVGAHCASRYYLVFQRDVFDLGSGELIDSMQYPDGTSAPRADDGTLIAYAIDYACGN
ncbi:hypothetical protein C7B61_01095 [filamentous cyanobacterium CCP1]|nr:hypothetical protein C7B76_20380 [filamentous cyanobacterium CCP2]PSB68401.1 hypothetical protein C7B61_01095 [filamentous cyanobacterium CCP1]